MRKTFLPVTVVTVMILLFSACGGAEADPTSYMFVVSGSSGSVDGSTLTLNDVPTVVYFSDRPERDAGQFSADELVGALDPSGAGADPANADLSIFSEDGPINSVVVLETASRDGSNFKFTVEVLEGALPEGDFGSATLFIDSCYTNPTPNCTCTTIDPNSTNPLC